MKKIFILFLILFFIFPIISFAQENDVKVESIELVSKSENVEEVSTANIDNNKINLDLKLYDPKDYIEYNIKIRNNSSNDYTIDKSKLSSSDEYLTYEFIYIESTDVIKPSEEKVLKLKVTYKNKVPTDKLENDSYILNKTVKLTLVEDTIIPEVIDNPPTGLVNPIIFYGLLIISVLGIFTLFKVNKKYKVLTVLITTALFIPLYTSATEKIDIDVNAKIEIDGKEAYFIPGEEFNVRVKKMASSDPSTIELSTNDENLVQVKESKVEPSIDNKKDENIVSTTDSPYPIYVWIEGNVLYWWSEDKSPNLNENSKSMFSRFTKITDISGISNWDASTCKSLFAIFNHLRSLKTLESIKNWDVSNVEIFDYAFSSNISLKDLKGLENWDVSKAKSLRCTFCGVESSDGNQYNMSIETLEALSNWDVSNVKDMTGIFQRNVMLKNLNGLENWKTSNLEKMWGMFHTCVSLEDTSALKNWNISNVSTMRATFMSCKKLEYNTGIQNWDTSSTTDMISLFQNEIELKELDVSSFDMSKVTLSSNFLTSASTNLQRIKTPKAYPTDSNIKIKLPGTFEDEAGNQYTELDNTCPTQVWLTKVQ